MSDRNLDSKTRFGIALSAFGRALFRLVAILLAAGILGTMIYFGFVTMYQQAVLPARDNENRISLLETRSASEQETLQARLDSFQDRLSVLEAQTNADTQSVEQVEAKADALELELSKLDLEFSALQEEVRNNSATDDLQTEALTGSFTRLDEIEDEIQVLRVASLLNRARIYLYQNNYGLASAEIDSARQILVQMQIRAQPLQQAALSAWIGRLDSALNNLPAQPLVAAEDLEIAWQFILGGLPGSRPTPTYYYTPVPEFFPTPDFTPTPYYSPTPYNTPTPFFQPTPNPT